MSRTSADAGAGENRQYRGPASVTAGMRKQLKRGKPQNCEAARSERDFEETPAIPFLGAAGVLPFLFGGGNVRNATMPPARKRAA